MDDNQAKTWDLAVKVLGLVALVASGLWTLYTYQVNRNIDLTRDNEAIERDTKSKQYELNSLIFQKQAELYLEGAKAAATIASSGDKTAIANATERFKELYFGELVVVEDRRVELAMISFESCLESRDRTCLRRQLNQHGTLLDPAALQRKYGRATPTNLSLELAACIRTALQQDRDIQFGNMTDAQTTCPYD
jgi:hypothetical protein